MTKYVIKKTGAFSWSGKEYSVEEIYAAIQSGKITDEWLAHDSKTSVVIRDLLAADDAKYRIENAKINNNGKESQIYILNDDNQEGPYTFEQVLSMHRTALIPATAMFWFEGLDGWHPVQKLVEVENIAAKASAVSNTSPHMRLGLFFVIIGLSLIFYFVGLYDTSVEVDSLYASAMDIDRVSNLSKMQNKQTGIIIGCFSTLLGFGLLAFAHSQRNKV